jgi:putative ABC transport system permease protein
VANAVVVTRGDSGTSVRSASDGIRLVYGLIGWGVLVVGGIGVLVAEMIVLRDRTWFFGLARAVGARRWSVAWLVLADIIIVLAAGLALALLVLVVTAPWVSSFGHTAFQVNLHVLRLSALPSLIAGLTFVLVLGGAYPAWRATRLDPLDVLERR